MRNINYKIDADLELPLDYDDEEKDITDIDLM